MWVTKPTTGSRGGVRRRSQESDVVLEARPWPRGVSRPNSYVLGLGAYGLGLKGPGVGLEG